jgi:GT2 family glycosyltransferase
VIDILIINYNCCQHLEQLLRSLTQNVQAVSSRRSHYTITVVDNSSEDESVNIVRQFPSVRVIARASNDGYAAAVNEGVEQTNNQDILLLNSDIMITPAEVAGLARVRERLGFQGILGPLHLESDGFPQLTWGEHPTFRAEFKRRELEHGLRLKRTWARKIALAMSCRTRQVGWISGSCMFFDRITYRKTGRWDENFFLYFEDIDWCLRARHKDIPIYHTPEIRVQHVHGASMLSNPVRSEVEYRRSQVYFTQKHFGSRRRFQVQIYVTGKYLIRFLLGKLSGTDRRTSMQILREVWKKPATPEKEVQ